VLTGLLRGIRLDLDLQAGEIQLWAGLYERETFSAIRRLVRGCRGAIDLGAARGDLVAYLLRQPELQRLVAVEPEVRELALLHRTLDLNGLTGDARLHVHAGFAGRGEPPAWRTLDELAAALPSPLFVKIDIDGPEAAVLADARGMLRAKDCRLLIETHSPEAESGCADLLSECGYAVTIIHPAWWRIFLPEHRPIPHNRWLSARRNHPVVPTP
jgi:hypothetical protein